MRVLGEGCKDVLDEKYMSDTFHCCQHIFKQTFFHVFFLFNERQREQVCAKNCEWPEGKEVRGVQKCNIFWMTERKVMGYR